MTEQICKVLAFMAWAVMTILVIGVPAVIGITAVVTLWTALWRWLGI